MESLSGRKDEIPSRPALGDVQRLFFPDRIGGADARGLMRCQGVVLGVG